MQDRRDEAREDRREVLPPLVVFGMVHAEGVQPAPQPVEQVEAHHQALKSNQTAYKAIQIGFEAGTRTTLDLINAQREQFRSKRDYARARYDYLIATLKLKAAVGALTEDDLTQINNFLK